MIYKRIRSQISTLSIGFWENDPEVILTGSSKAWIDDVIGMTHHFWPQNSEIRTQYFSVCGSEQVLMSWFNQEDRLKKITEFGKNFKTVTVSLNLIKSIFIEFLEFSSWWRKTIEILWNWDSSDLWVLQEWNISAKIKHAKMI